MTARLGVYYLLYPPPDDVLGVPDNLQGLEVTRHIGHWLGDLESRPGHVENHLVLGVRKLQVARVPTVCHLATLKNGISSDGQSYLGIFSKSTENALRYIRELYTLD